MYWALPHCHIAHILSRSWLIVQALAAASGCEVRRAIFAPPLLDRRTTSKRADEMGNAAARSWTRFWTRHERRLLLVGLDAAGKTTILYHLRLGKAISSIPTLGFNVETVKFDRFKLHLWVRRLLVAHIAIDSWLSLPACLIACAGRWRTGRAEAILATSLHRDAGIHTANAAVRDCWNTEAVGAGC